MILEATQISKTYSKTRKKRSFTLSVDHLSIAEGSFTAVLGPNGSGKSTFIKIMLDLIFADTGTLKLLGTDHKNKKAREGVGYLPENFSFPKNFTVRQVMTAFGEINNPQDKVGPRIEELASALNVDYLDEKIKNLSKGMRQTTAIMHTLLGDHRFYILDEPLNGLDAVQKQLIIKYLLHLKETKNISMLITTHILSDIEKLCDTIHLIKQGKIVDSSSKEDIQKQFASVETYYLNYFEPQFGVRP